MKALLMALLLASTAATAAQAQPLDALLQRDAAQQSRLATDVARGRIDVHNAAWLVRQESDLQRLQAGLIGNSPPGEQAIGKLRQAERNMAGALSWAEQHREARIGSRMDRLHLRVATSRAAEQEHLIAHEFRKGTLSPQDLSALQAAQARIARAQFQAVRNGDESLAAARSIQDRQNIQDYAIRKNPLLVAGPAPYPPAPVES